MLLFIFTASITVNAIQHLNSNEVIIYIEEEKDIFIPYPVNVTTYNPENEILWPVRYGIYFYTFIPR